MSKRKVINLNEAWWVWIGEDPAIRVETQKEAMDLLQSKGKDYTIRNSYGRSDFASPVVELLWNTPVPEGQSFHKTVISPVMFVKYNNDIRKMIEYIPPSKSTSLFKSWYELEPELPAWIPNQYNEAVNDSNCLIIKGKKSIVDQLNNKFSI